MEIPSLSTLKSGVLQPWGVMNDGFITSTRFPPHWKRNAGLTDAQREQDFAQWRDDLMALINEHLWPIYDPSSREWRGKSIEHMDDLTIADLELIAEIQTSPAHFQQRIESPLRSLEKKTHADLFLVEDDARGSKVFSSFRLYDRTMDAATLSAISDVCFDANDFKKANVSIVFKTALQRPRPMQTSFRFQRPITHKEAGTAGSSSMSSGHSLQGVLCVGGLIEELLDAGVPISTERQLALGQWAVDIGDRRVMAGVHYPADNLCSWLIFLSMADKVFHRPEIRKIIAGAIDKQSFVLRNIRRRVDAGKGAAYQPALRLLHSMI